MPPPQLIENVMLKHHGKALIATLFKIARTLLGSALIAFSSATYAHAVDEMLVLESAEAVTLGEQVQLPHNWTHDPEGMFGVVHYRLKFAKPINASELQALYLPHINMSVKARLNGQVIGQSGFDQQPTGRYFHTPIMYGYPSTLYVQGENVLDIEVRSYANRFGFLSPVSIGDYDQLEPIYANAYFENNTLQIVSTALSGIFVLLLIPVWWARRKSMFAWFIAGSLAWSISGLNVFLHEIPMPAAMWEWLIHISIGLVPLCYGLFIFRLTEQRYPRLENSLLVASALFIMASVFFAGKASFFTITSLWHASVLMFGAFAIYRLFRYLLGKRDFSVFYIASSLVLVCALAIHDLVIQQLSAQHTNFWLNYTAPLLLTAMGLLMVRQFVTAVQNAEELNISLETRVTEARAALQESYAELRILEMNRAVHNERERIYRNLHDDVGAKLLGLAISAQRANQTREAELARSALRDLREVVSRSNKISVELADLLADLRAETEQRVNAAAVDIQWQTDSKKLGSLLVSAEASLHLSRILREATSNALHHSSASRITVTVRFEEDMLNIDIADNGVGVAADFKANRGMESMMARAATLQGSLVLGGGESGGCVVHLSVPLSSLSVTELSSDVPRSL